MTICWATHSGLVPTVEREFVCNDPSISLPLKPNTVSLGLLLTVCISFPLVTIACLEGLLCRRSRLKNKHMTFVAFMSQVVWKYFFGFFIVMAVMMGSKAAVGRLRPHFLSVCRPKVSDGQCSGVLLSQGLCSTANAHVLKIARESFPSGHATLSVYSLSFLLLYLASRYKLLASHKFLLLTLTTVDIVWTAVCCVTRVTDYWHHVSDVFAGCAIGIACLSVMFLSRRWAPFLINDYVAISPPSATL